MNAWTNLVCDPPQADLQESSRVRTLHILVEHLTTDNDPEGLAVREDGSVMRELEEPEEDEEVPAGTVTGENDGGRYFDCGSGKRRVKRPAVWYGKDWEFNTAPEADDDMDDKTYSK
ncbi:hypothetical protein VKT23_004476 [Stygiomarasmius scandens]|uniref:Uncharacterized protein n=1 Tax=Marasmiellus scandens TaxID=2682957 RepID=A0ABR1JWS4_9AGAR